DSKSLLLMDEVYIKDSKYEEAQTETEKKLVDIWKSILQVDDISINDNFFDVGGNSLSLMKMAAYINKHFKIKASIKKLFEYCDIKSIAKYIDSNKKVIYKEIKKSIKKDYYEASPAQKRMYVLNNMDTTGIAYNMPAFIELSGALDLKKINEIFKFLVKRHEAFRTSFSIVNNLLVQNITENVEFDVDFEESNGCIEFDEIKNNFIKKFDLNNGNLIRVKLLKVAENKHILMLDMNHIISDGESINLIIREFLELYNGKKLEENKIDYTDYSEWKNEAQNTFKIIEKQEKYWANKLKGKLQKLNIRGDYDRPLIRSFKGSKYYFTIENNIITKLKKICNETETTMYMLFLSVINILLSKYSNQKDILIGTPVSGRTNIELNNIVGLFVNTLVMRNKIDDNKSYYNFLKEVKTTCIEAYENQEYEFDNLVKVVDFEKDNSHNDIFDFMFVMQDDINSKLQFDDFDCKIIELNTDVSKFDMTFFAVNKKDKIDFTIEYCTDIFSIDTIKVFEESFRKIL
ncbi:non-ribosomal peptide synthetase, partial [Clostridium perfringens]|uniref:condensation domain-containing protein n=1 Tax=Clostridium perfringens TaxID=1502 RepID=UPI0014181D7D